MWGEQRIVILSSDADSPTPALFAPSDFPTPLAIEAQSLSQKTPLSGLHPEAPECVHADIVRQENVRRQSRRAMGLYLRSSVCVVFPSLLQLLMIFAMRLPLEIVGIKTLAALKKAIKEEKPAFDHVPANTLKLWNVSLF
jgi:hypothetical protein